MEKVIETYRGIDIILSCGYYYPSVNGNVECKFIQDVKYYLDNIWFWQP